MIDIHLTAIGKTAFSLSLLPGLVAVDLGVAALELRAISGILGLGIDGGFATVVIDNDFIGIGIALARQHHVGPGIFEHRNQERQHVALCVQIFYGLKNAGSLPLPPVELGLVIPSVALPHGYMATLQTFFKR